MHVAIMQKSRAKRIQHQATPVKAHIQQNRRPQSLHFGKVIVPAPRRQRIGKLGLELFMG